MSLIPKEAPKSEIVIEVKPWTSGTCPPVTPLTTDEYEGFVKVVGESAFVDVCDVLTPNRAHRQPSVFRALTPRPLVVDDRMKALIADVGPPNPLYVVCGAFAFALVVIREVPA